MSEVSTPPSSPPRYTPPPELVQAAEELLRSARPADLACAAAYYDAYGSVTGGRSAVTGALLPRFEECSSLVRAAHVTGVRQLLQQAGPLLHPKSDKHVTDARRVTLYVDMSGLEQELGRLERIVDSIGRQDAEDEGQVDPFLLGLGNIAAATKALAEASRMAATSPHHEALGALITTIVAALNERVKALAQPLA